MKENCRSTSINLFIVEDNYTTIALYKKLFRYHEFNILDIACDGLEAIEKYKQLKFKPDVVLMDFKMPNMNGVEAYKKIMQFDPEAKIIFVSSDPKIRDYVLSIGAKDFLEKPIDINELRQKIIKIL